jgi:ubiquinone/menaquinone biosynthesis C-methylase UbiE
MTSIHEGQFSAAWSEPVEEQIRELLSHARQMPWCSALDWLRTKHSGFAARLDREWLSDWTLLVHPSQRHRALDLGCGFGTLTLGLAHSFDHVVGIDVLPLRLAIAAARRRSLGLKNVQFIQADGCVLPLRGKSFDLVVLNGVLEWAALAGAEKPEIAQVRVLSEVQRMLSNDGIVGVAIENRFALETWSLTPDTHTGMLLLPLLPRWMARALYRVRVGRRLPVQLHSHRGYRRLFQRAGFAAVRLLDLAPSYNDYDVIIDPDDRASYRFLWQRRLVRSFNPVSRSIRRQLAWVVPGVLGSLSYAYLVIAGKSVITPLDISHSIWTALEPYGISPGAHRFGCRGHTAGSFAIVSHDGENVSSIVEIGSRIADTERTTPMPEIMRDLASSPDLKLRAEVLFHGTPVRAWTQARHAARTAQAVSRPQETADDCQSAGSSFRNERLTIGALFAQIRSNSSSR